MLIIPKFYSYPRTVVATLILVQRNSTTHQRVGKAIRSRLQPHNQVGVKQKEAEVLQVEVIKFHHLCVHCFCWRTMIGDSMLRDLQQRRHVEHVLDSLIRIA